ncbi:MAG: M10 family metallopeptidase [Defluviicoccus sp.]
MSLSAEPVLAAHAAAGPAAAPQPSSVAPTGYGAWSSVAKSGTATTDALVGGSKWGSGAVGQAVTVTYSFAQSGLLWRSGYGSGEPTNGFQALTGTQIEVARKALNAWSAVANITFVEVTESDTAVGDMRFAASSLPPTAWAYYPGGSAEGGDVWLGRNSYFNSTADGSYSLLGLMHEIGHALGLKHPHETDGSGVVMAVNLDYLGNSVMSYRSYLNQPIGGAYTNTFFPSTPGVFDIAALQYLYGANMATNAGNTTYQWGAGEQTLETIWDGGGTDAIDWSNQASAAEINLTAGVWSRLGPTYYTAGGENAKTLNIALGVTIENAFGGSAGDVIRGNDANNLIHGNAGNDTLEGGTGADVLEGGDGNDAIYGRNKGVVTADGNDTIKGGAGNDTIEGGAGNDAINGDEGNDLVYGGTGNDTLYGHYSNDTLIGGAGNDFLSGYSSNDSLVGETGNDTLYGHTGRDTLDGGVGYDTFVYTSTAQSKAGSSNRDQIYFGGPGTFVEDVIDVSAIDADLTIAGDQAFVFIGTAAFTGPGQIRVQAGGADTLILFNTDANLSTEMEILSRDGSAYAPGDYVASDFIL